MMQQQVDCLLFLGAGGEAVVESEIEQAEQGKSDAAIVSLPSSLPL